MGPEINIIAQLYIKLRKKESIIILQNLYYQALLLITGITKWHHLGGPPNFLRQGCSSEISMEPQRGTNLGMARVNFKP